MNARALVRRAWPAAAIAALGAAALVSLAMRSAASDGLRFAISFPAARSAQPIDGRVLLFISDDGRTDPKSQSDQYRANSTRPIFGVDVDGLAPGQDAVIDERVAGWPVRSLKDIPAGEYFVQAIVNRYETFYRSDGHTITMPMDHGEGQHWDTKPGNFYSKPVKMRIDPSRGGEIRISMDQEIPPIAPPHDTPQVKYLTVPNERLSQFWGRPMALGVIVTLPQGWESHPNARYPVLIHHGHFPRNAESDTWRETPPDPNATGTQRDTQAAAYQFYKDWNGPRFPRMIHVLIQHPTLYFDDSYAVNSANNGPYGDAITRDLLPVIEQKFRGIGQPWARVMTGGLTGGWEALGVQVFYPDDYNGAWALCPDPVDFRSYRSVNIYDEHNAYYYEDNPWKKTPKPGYRDYRDHLFSTFEDRNLVELALGTHGRSAGQHDAWASVFGPVGDDGYYQPLYDKLTGAIDPEVARYWRDHYDLRFIMQRDWASLGPRLRGKIHLTSGTMDNGYLNNAMYQMEEFLMRATPSAEAEIVYGERREHCFTGDTEHPNPVGSRTVHQRYMPAMAQWMIRSAPPGADTRSWVVLEAAMTALETPFTLVVVGPGIDAAYPLSRKAMTIGRAPAMPDVEVAGEDVSPRHCVVQWNDVTGGHALRVFGASGAWLNSARVPGDGAVHALSPGDEFRIGATTFTYRTALAASHAADEVAVDVPTVHAAPTSREVYEFEVIPRLVGREFDWKHPLVSYGPRRRVEAPMQAVRVVISKGAPRAAIVGALKHVTDLIESSGSVSDRSPAPLVTLSEWFD